MRFYTPQGIPQNSKVNGFDRSLYEERAQLVRWSYEGNLSPENKARLNELNQLLDAKSDGRAVGERAKRRKP